MALTLLLLVAGALIFPLQLQDKFLPFHSLYYKPLLTEGDGCLLDSPTKLIPLTSSSKRGSFLLTIPKQARASIISLCIAALSCTLSGDVRWRTAFNMHK